jgi:hypothetical protein
MLNRKKEGVMAIIAGYKPKTETAGQVVSGDNEEAEGSDASAADIAMKEFIRCIKAGDAKGALVAYTTLHEEVDEQLGEPAQEAGQVVEGSEG